MSALSRWAEEVQGKTADQAYVYYKQQDSKDRRTQQNINSMVANAFKNVNIQFKAQQNDEIGKVLTSRTDSQEEKLQDHETRISILEEEQKKEN